jgi:hypothetical protein
VSKLDDFADQSRLLYFSEGYLYEYKSTANTTSNHATYDKIYLIGISESFLVTFILKSFSESVISCIFAALKTSMFMYHNNHFTTNNPPVAA